MAVCINSKNEVEVYIPYNPEMIVKFKQNKFRWNVRKRCWYKNLKYVSSTFLNEFELQGKLKEWVQSYLNIKSTCSFGIAFDLKPFQQIAVDNATKNTSLQLLADDTGLGKTIQALSIATSLFKNDILVVCPSALKQQWAEEIEKFKFGKSLVLNGDKKTRINTYHSYKDAVNNSIDGLNNILIVNWEQIRLNSFLTSNLWNFVIFDECHRLQNTKTKTYKSCKKLIAHRYLYLTATPLTNTPINLFNLLSFIDPDIISYPSFMRKFVVMGKIWNLNIKKTIDVPVGFKNIPELYEYLSPIMIRRRKEEVLDQLPEVAYITYRPTLSTQQKKTYNTLLKTGKETPTQRLGCMMLMQSVCNSGELIKMSDSLNALMLPEEIKNDTHSTKLKCLLEDIIPTITEKTVIFTQSKKMANIIHNNMKKSHIITGDTKDKQEFLKRFIKDESLFLIATDCLREGVNLQTCGTLIHFDLIYSQSKMIQREGRINRIGSKQKLTVIKLITKNTIEEEVEKILKEKTKMQLQAVDGYKDDIIQVVLQKMFEVGK